MEPKVGRYLEVSGIRLEESSVYHRPQIVTLQSQIINLTFSYPDVVITEDMRKSSKISIFI